MSEHHIPVRYEVSRSAEHHKPSQEYLAKLEASRAEKATEHSHSDKSRETEAASHEAYETAVSAAEYAPAKSEHSPAEIFNSRQTKEHAFNTTMHHVRTRMKKPERAFSGFIHKPAVEKTSEILGKTVARPSGIVGATIAAFIGLLSVYSIAKFAGFQLSGSEMPILLLLGFAAGLFIEWAYKATRSILLTLRG